MATAIVTARVRNWHKRNLAAAEERVATVTVCGNAAPGNEHLQLVVRNSKDQRILVTFTPEEALQFAAMVEHCMSRVLAMGWHRASF